MLRVDRAALVEISLTVSPIYTPKGNITGASKIARDISDRKKSQQLIIRELTHRTRNLFAVFQAIAARAVDESKTAAEIKYVLNDRLQALARAYQVIAEGGGASLAAILEREFSGFSRQVKFGGCDIVVNPSAAQQFARPHGNVFGKNPHSPCMPSRRFPPPWSVEKQSACLCVTSTGSLPDLRNLAAVRYVHAR
jgi:hypothetical protein